MLLRMIYGKGSFLTLPDARTLSYPPGMAGKSVSNGHYQRYLDTYGSFLLAFPNW